MKSLLKYLKKYGKKGVDAASGAADGGRKLLSGGVNELQAFSKKPASKAFIGSLLAGGAAGAGLGAYALSDDEDEDDKKKKKKKRAYMTDEE